jgi:hypothetical protein
MEARIHGVSSELLQGEVQLSESKLYS